MSYTESKEWEGINKYLIKSNIVNLHLCWEVLAVFHTIRECALAFCLHSYVSANKRQYIYNVYTTFRTYSYVEEVILVAFTYYIDFRSYTSCKLHFNTKYLGWCSRSSGSIPHTCVCHMALGTPSYETQLCWELNTSAPTGTQSIKYIHIVHQRYVYSSSLQLCNTYLRNHCTGQFEGVGINSHDKFIV